MNLSMLTPRQWAYVLHRVDYPDEEPLPHPGNPRKQSLDRIADQLSDQLDRDELRQLRAMVAGKRPAGVAGDEESGRDLDADAVDDVEPGESLDEREAYIARAFRPAQRPEGPAGRRTREAETEQDNRPAAEDSGGERVSEPETPPPTSGRDQARVQPVRPQRRHARLPLPAVPGDGPQATTVPRVAGRSSASPPPLPREPAAPAAERDVLQPRLF